MIQNKKYRFRAESEEDRCVACGVCMNVCPREAIHIHKGCYAVVDRDKCVGCGLCVKACPAGVMHKIENV
ncbi:MAG: 4Fe-4S binding protein [Bacteroidaceae bacterium]|nr:4Fe-4S binding protein [Bacteroidaceae bacterium]